MRKLLVLVSALAAACGGGSSKQGPTPLTGTIAGNAFTPADAKALIVQTPGTSTCTANGLTFAATGLALEVTSYPDACGDFGAAQCTFRKSQVTVTVLLAMLDAQPPYAAPTVPAGSYPINASASTVNPDGSVVYAQATVTDPTCNGGSPTPIPSQSGTLRIDTITASEITGHVSVTFQNPGGSLSGDFTAPRCTSAPGVSDVCTLVTNATGAQLSGQPTMLYCTMPGTCT